MCGIQEGKRIGWWHPVRCTHDPPGFDRTGAGSKGPISERSMHVRLGVHPVTHTGPRRWEQNAVALEVAHLLDGVPGLSSDIDRAHTRRLATFHRRPAERLRGTLHRHTSETLEHMSIDEIIAFLDGLEGS